jgi:pyridoxamine 5'-phosphate oxidase
MPSVRHWLDEATRERVQRLKALCCELGYGVFYTHYGSRKSAELIENPWAAAILHWDKLGRQIRFEGPVVRSPAAESDEYFRSRPWRSQLNAWSSMQSAPLRDPADLQRAARRRAAELGLPDPQEAREAGPIPAVPRPEFWGGYRLWFQAVEFWVEGTDRFHDRIRYERPLTRQGDEGFIAGGWTSQRLQP